MQQLEDDGFLALDAKRIDRIQQVNPQLFSQHANQREDLIEIRVHLEGACPVFQRLGKFAVGNIAVRNKNKGLKSARAGVRGHGSGGVAGGDAGYAGDA